MSTKVLRNGHLGPEDAAEMGSSFQVLRLDLSQDCLPALNPAVPSLAQHQQMLHTRVTHLLHHSDDPAALKLLVEMFVSQSGIQHPDWARKVLNRAWGADASTFMMDAAMQNRWRCVDLLAKLGCEVNARSEATGFTALHCACFYGWVETALTLLQLGANPSITNHAGDTPLQAAMANEHQELVAEMNGFLQRQVAPRSLPFVNSPAEVAAANSIYIGCRKRQRPTIDLAQLRGENMAAAAPSSNPFACTAMDRHIKHALSERSDPFDVEGVEASGPVPEKWANSEFWRNYYAYECFEREKGSRPQAQLDKYPQGGGGGGGGGGSAAAAAAAAAASRSRAQADPMLRGGQGLSYGQEHAQGQGQAPQSKGHPGRAKPDPEPQPQGNGSGTGAGGPPKSAAAQAQADPQPTYCPGDVDYKVVIQKSNCLKPNAEFLLPAGSSNTLGRNHHQCDIVVSELMVSKTHARFSVDARGVMINDLNSKHGILVGVRKAGEHGDRVTRYPVPVPAEGLKIVPGDEICVGSTVLVLAVAEDRREKSNSPVGQKPSESAGQFKKGEDGYGKDGNDRAKPSKRGFPGSGSDVAPPSKEMRKELGS